MKNKLNRLYGTSFQMKNKQNVYSSHSFQIDAKCVCVCVYSTKSKHCTNTNVDAERRSSIPCGYKRFFNVVFSNADSSRLQVIIEA